jgi:serine/threonine protein kinase
MQEIKKALLAMSIESILSRPDRCVFKDTSSGNFYKIFLGDSKVDDFFREYFFTKFLNQSPTKIDSGIVQFVKGEYQTPTTLLQSFTQTNSACKLGEEDFPISYIQTKPVEGEDLGTWLEKQTEKAISKDVIRKIAFQIVFILAEMHSKFGIQYNDLQETNIRVVRVEKDENRIYDTDADKFEIDFKKGDMKVVFLDFGSATLKKTKSYPSKKKDEKSWNTSDVAVLQINNSPETFFDLRSTNARHCETDLFMLGHVLLSLHLHNNYKTFRYTSRRGIHVSNIAQDLKDFRIDSSKTPDIRQLAKDSLDTDFRTAEPKDPLFEASGNLIAEEVIQIFFVNLLALNYALQGKVERPDYVEKNKNAKEFFDAFADSDYVKKRFAGIVEACDDKSFIKNLMQFDTSKRQGVKSYALSGYMFHPYFAEFYKGKKTNTSGTLNLVPPYENAAKKDLRIQSKIDKFEEGFEKEQKKYFETYKKDYIAPIDKKLGLEVLKPTPKTKEELAKILEEKKGGPFLNGVTIPDRKELWNIFDNSRKVTGILHVLWQLEKEDQDTESIIKCLFISGFKKKKV